MNLALLSRRARTRTFRASSRVKTHRFEREVAPLLSALNAIATSGVLPHPFQKWDPSFGPVHRITDRAAATRHATNRSAKRRSFSRANFLLLTHATDDIFERHDHVVPSTWGTQADWLTVGRRICPEELANGVVLCDARGSENGDVVFHATQLVNYQPPKTTPLPGTCQVTLAAVAALEGVGVPLRPYFANNYSPRRDVISLIPKDHFSDAATYVKVLAHELAHASGAKHRLNRESLVLPVELGDVNYRFEEVVAEVASFIVMRRLLNHFSKEFSEPVWVPQGLVGKSAEYVWRHLQSPRSELRDLQNALTNAERAASWIIDVAL